MKQTRNRLSAVFEPIPEQKPWEWAVENVDFSINPAYPTEYRGKYDSELLPFWKEPLEALVDPSVREVAILKNSQAGGTENVPLNLIRYHAAVNPCRILYVWGDEKAAKEDFKERIVGGLKCSSSGREKIKRSRCVEGRVDMPDMVIAAAWPKNKMAFKRNPWSCIVADEFSTYPDMTPDMMRKRCDTVPFSHICWISSPDPTMRRGSTEDPIFQEFWAGDMREWMCKDPKSGRLFKWEMGSPETVHGLKWEGRKEDGTWDFEKVKESAHYVTPDGTKIMEAERMSLVRSGEWVAQRKDAPVDRRSYHTNAFLMPFKSGELGNIAVSFLRAKSNGASALKTFVYEYLAEAFYESKEDAKENVLGKRQYDYKRGECFSEHPDFKTIYLAKQKAVVAGVDVQKDYFPYIVREYVDGGDSGLVAWGNCISENDLNDMYDEFNVDMVGVDYGYSYREYEVMQMALKSQQGSPQWIIPLKGNDNLNTSLLYSKRDPFLGKAGAGEHNVETYSWHTDTFRTLYLQMLRGESKENWFVYNGIEMDYAKQATAMEKVDGEWRNRKGHSQDHYFDCECMSLVIARILGMYQNFMLEEKDERNV